MVSFLFMLLFISLGVTSKTHLFVLVFVKFFLFWRWFSFHQLFIQSTDLCYCTLQRVFRHDLSGSFFSNFFLLNPIYFFLCLFIFLLVFVQEFPTGPLSDSWCSPAWFSKVTLKPYRSFIMTPWYPFRSNLRQHSSCKIYSWEKSSCPVIFLSSGIRFAICPSGRHGVSLTRLAWPSLKVMLF